MTLQQEHPEDSPQLDDAKATLLNRLEEACRTGLSAGPPETTGELLRLEDALVAAAKATEEMLLLRRHEKELKRVDESEPAADADAPRGGRPRADEEVPLTQGHERIREFRDDNGCEWRAWAVIPGLASPNAQRHLGELRDGWLAFEALDGTARRRLPHYPADWMMLSDAQLAELLQTAAEVPVRRKLRPLE